MDNLTHTLAGLLVGESCFRFLRVEASGLPAPERRNLLLVLGVVGSNLPDADFFYSLATQSKLDYLSQHRGYTHTIIGILAAAVLMFAVAQLWLRLRRLRPAGGDRRAVATVVVAALALHLLMDYTNNYGVHPFWPVINDWVYGDSVFIIEPALWIAAAPLFFLLRSRTARSLLAMVLIGALILCFFTPWVLPASGVVLAALLALLLFVGWKGSARLALSSSIGAWLLVTAGFVVAGQVAGRRVEAAESAEAARAAEAAGAAASMQSVRLVRLDNVLTPMPANPLCWQVIAVSRDDSQFVLQRGVLSLAPAVVAAGACPDNSARADTTAPLAAVRPDGSATALHWRDEIRMSRAQLTAVIREHCDAAVFMRFARAPWIAQREGRWVIGDLRYDREPELGFAELALDGTSPDCTSRMPPWTAPRRDLLP